METTATPKTIDKATIDAAADEAGLSVSEFVEWGMYAFIETFSNCEHSSGDAKDYMPTLRGLGGGVAPGIIHQSPLEAFAESESMTMNELAEAAILTATDMVKNSEYPNQTPKDILCDYRFRQRLLIPEIGNENHTVHRTESKVHPFMHRLFSGDLKAVHGPSFGDLCSDEVDGEHQFMEDNLKRAFAANSWEEACCDLMILESVIHHCPKLQNEAAAIRALIEAENVLGAFCRAVNAA